MQKHFYVFFFSLCFFLFTSSSSSAIIHGTLGACVGSTSTLIDTVVGSVTSGTWSSSNTTVATVGSSTGIVTGVAAGTSVITFHNSTGSTSTAVFTVSTPPAAIAGGGTPFCVGTSITLSNTVSGGYWSISSGSAAGASIDSFSGVLFSGTSGGTATVRYTMGIGCFAYTTVTVNGAPFVDTIFGSASSICLGSSHSYTSSTAGGTWSSSNPAVASISASGVVSALSNGTTVISYTVIGACDTGYRTKNIIVTDTTAFAPIYGPAVVATGHNITLHNARPGGTWSSSNPSVASIGPYGVVSGISAGTTVISYLVTGCSGAVYATTTINVLSDCISGNILFSAGAGSSTDLKVWLIKYNPTTLMLTAVDSTIGEYVTSGIFRYVFCNVGADSFRVKAAYDSIFFTSSTHYLPTYHNASSFWNTATVINHSLGVHDLNKNINMGIGTTTSPGPGFIGGDVTTGANKGTADGDPVPGLLVVCVNDATGAVVQHTYTDATGAYEFTNLALGTYRIHPEFINYATVAYPAVTLSAASTSMTAASFRKNTLSKTITPILVSVKEVANPQNVMVTVHPNPAHNQFTLTVDGQVAANVTAYLCDITGKVLQTIPTTTATTTIDVSGLPMGLYLLRYTDGSNNKTIKISIQ